GHARGAHRLAGAAAEAEIEMRDRGVAQLEPSLRERLHDEDAAARRVHLGAEDGERGAVREAEAAVDAGVHALHVVAVEGERTCWRGGQGFVGHGFSVLASLPLTLPSPPPGARVLRSPLEGRGASRRTLTPALSLREGEGVAHPSPPEGER